jgi:hypothetical protein
MAQITREKSNEMEMDRRQVTQLPATPLEQDMWQKIESNTSVKERAKGAEEYLKKYPEGAFAPFCHEILAVDAWQREKAKDFLEHGEKAVEVLVNAPALLSSLSAAYADQEPPNAEPAIQHGNRALNVLNGEITPEQPTIGLWTRKPDENLVDAYYGVGTAYLFKAFNEQSSKLMTAALDNLVKATEANPYDERSRFRLGFAYQVKGDLDSASIEYARSVALKGANSKTAEQYLAQAYQTIHGDTKGLEEFVKAQEEYFDDLRKNP